MHAAHAILPVLVNGLTSHAKDGNAKTPLIAGRDLKSARVNDAVHLKFFAISDNAALSNSLNALGGADIDQFDVVTIKGLKIMIIERRAFTELVVVRL